MMAMVILEGSSWCSRHHQALVYSLLPGIRGVFTLKAIRGIIGIVYNVLSGILCHSTEC
jgi:hypothetical protein